MITSKVLFQWVRSSNRYHRTIIDETSRSKDDLERDAQSEATNLERNLPVNIVLVVLFFQSAIQRN